jgi:hypothetical protein
MKNEERLSWNEPRDVIEDAIDLQCAIQSVLYLSVLPSPPESQ